MKCVHFWVTDSKGFARCKHCGKTKQFKGYGYEHLKPKTNWMRSTARRDFGIHPDLCAKSYVRVT